MALDAESRTAVSLEGRAVPVTIDTGCEPILIDSALAAALRLVNAGPPPTIRDANGVLLPAQALVTFDRLEFGTLSANGEAGVLDLPGRVGSGLIGMIVLRHCCCLFDFKAGALHVTVGDLGDELVARHGMRVLEKVSLGDDPLRPMVTVRIEDRVDVPLLVDTGASRTGLPPAIVTRLGLSPSMRSVVPARPGRDEAIERLGVEIPAPEPEPETVRALGVHGRYVEQPVYRVSRLAVGGFEVGDLGVTADETARLGRDVLARMPWLLHGPRRELWLLAPR